MSKQTLKSLRANKNLTQKQAAELIGVSPFTWGNWEKGKTYPSLLEILKIEKSFNVAFSDINFLP